MLVQDKITARQFMILVLFFTIGNTFIDEPGELASKAGKDGWISALFATFFALGLIWLWTQLQKRIGDLNLIEANEVFLGKVIGKCISFAFFVFFMVNFLYTSFIFTNFTATNILQGESKLILAILFMIVVLFTVRKGLRNIARVAEFVLPLVGIFLLALFILVIPSVEMELIFPLFTSGSEQIKEGVKDTLGSPFFELITLMVIFASVKENDKNKSFYIGTMLGGLVLITLTFLCVVSLGAVQVSQSVYPSFNLAKMINLGEFFNRVESIVSISWLISQLIYGAISFYAACYTLAKILNVESYCFLTYPLALISLIYMPSVLGVRTLVHMEYWFSISFWFAIVFPLFLIIVVLIRKKDLHEIGAEVVVEKS